MKILIAEDEFVSRKLLNTILAPLGEVDIAANGNEAFKAVKLAFENDDSYDLICLDIMMPEVDGIMALKMIRQLEAEKGVNSETRSKIFMISAVSQKDHVLATVKAGCDCFLVKPIDKNRLYDEIRKHGFDISQ